MSTVISFCQDHILLIAVGLILVFVLAHFLHDAIMQGFADVRRWLDTAMGAIGSVLSRTVGKLVELACAAIDHMMPKADSDGYAPPKGLVLIVAFALAAMWLLLTLSDLSLMYARITGLDAEASGFGGSIVGVLSAGVFFFGLSCGGVILADLSGVGTGHHVLFNSSPHWAKQAWGSLGVISMVALFAAGIVLGIASELANQNLDAGTLKIVFWSLVIGGGLLAVILGALGLLQVLGACFAFLLYGVCGIAYVLWGTTWTVWFVLVCILGILKFVADILIGVPARIGRWLGTAVTGAALATRRRFEKRRLGRVNEPA